MTSLPLDLWGTHASVIRTQACGKVFVVGEYAVLRGYPALLVPSQERVHVHIQASVSDNWQFYSARGHVVKFKLQTQSQSLLTQTDPRIRFVLAGIYAARDVLNLMGLNKPIPTATIYVDSEELYHLNAGKKGLGSSAAVTVAVFRAVCQLWSLVHAASILQAPCLDPLQDLQVLAILRAWHNEAQNSQGSGADIATSFYQAPIVFSVQAKEPRVCVLKEPLAPMGLCFHSESASTPDFLKRISGHDDHMESLLMQLGQLSADYIDSLKTRIQKPALHLIEQINQTLNMLGQHIRAPIITPAHQALVQICQPFYAVSKPSGAGGGDLSLIFAPDLTWLQAALAQANKNGMYTTLLTTERE